ncbi:dnaJ protein homolog 1 [Drosophila erecta]|uniref:J domain-containing protein n=1 Tax=Drosophila erecta TaxID=7220 RepID=B3NW25_DROER|nr:dnaJ protein homolog 1 [Drosophila erecta]EDV46158.1 uncharacterized protein Dere_GG18918 [Drosophila erecta]
MTKDYYKVLGIQRNASDDQIRKAYRKQALRYHPDKNKHAHAEERFKEVAEAYEVLSDKKKRQLYDTQGQQDTRRSSADHSSDFDEGMAFGSGGFSYHFHGDPRATFAQFFGSSDPFTSFFEDIGRLFETDEDFSLGRGVGAAGLRSAQLSPEPTIEHELYVALEDIANGCNKRMKISRAMVLSSGELIRKDKILDVEIRPGWKSGTRITFPKEGDQLLNHEPADVVFIIRDKPHSIFRRDGSDLLYTAEISLKDALCGAHVMVPTLQSGPLELCTKAGEVIKPDSTRRFAGHGLPHPRDNTRRGAIIVSFSIKFPDTISKHIASSLAILMPN